MGIYFFIFCVSWCGFYAFSGWGEGVFCFVFLLATHNDVYYARGYNLSPLTNYIIRSSSVGVF